MVNNSTTIKFVLCVPTNYTLLPWPIVELKVSIKTICYHVDQVNRGRAQYGEV
jgi:hypothetical protein